MQNVTLTPAIFIDRDGVINANRPDHVKRWEEFVFLPGALDALQALASQPALVFVITNQAIIGRGVAPAAIVEDIHARMRASVAAAGGRIDGVYLCPHRPEDGCDCRKPRPGMLLRAAREHGLDLSRSIFIGDALSDAQAAAAAGVTPILVSSGRRAEQRKALLADPWLRGTRFVDDLGAAVAVILEAQNRPHRPRFCAGA
ncbi:MAG: HAD-IIIA family hydrolase [Thermoflexales bacterium]